MPLKMCTVGHKNVSATVKFDLLTPKSEATWDGGIIKYNIGLG